MLKNYKKNTIGLYFYYSSLFMYIVNLTYVQIDFNKNNTYI